MRVILLIAFVLSITFSQNIAAQNSSFYCEASAILQMDFFGELEKGKLTSDINVIIEGSLFVVEQEHITDFSLTIKSGDESILFSFKTYNPELKYWITLSTQNGFGAVKTDYRGVTLDDDVYCRLK